MTLIHSKISFVDQIPHLLREKVNLTEFLDSMICLISKTDSSEYSYFNSTKLKLFAGPYLWKYTNLLSDTIKFNPISTRQACTVHSRIPSRRQFRLDLFNNEQNQTLDELMSVNFWRRKSLKKRQRKILPTTLRKIRHFHSTENNRYQLRLSRRIRPLTDLSSLNHFPDFNLQLVSDIYENYSIDDVDPLHFDTFIYENPFPESLQYDFIRPIHYEKIEFDRNFAKIDAKKLQIQLNDEYNREYTITSNPISLSTLCVKLLDQGIISVEKDQIASTFYCMLNNCNKNHLYMKNNPQNDDLIIQKQPFVDSAQLIYSHSRI